MKISGLKTYIDFYDCADDLTDCYTLLFNVSLDLKDGTTLDKANEWNSKQITGRVWLDDNKDPTLDYRVLDLQRRVGGHLRPERQALGQEDRRPQGLLRILRILTSG